MNDLAKSPAPPGAMLEVSVDLVDEGGFKAELDTALREGYKGLVNYERATQDLTGKVTITATLVLARVPGSTQMMAVLHKVSTKLPERSKVSTAIDRGGRLLCQPVGTNDDANQAVFFDIMGRPIDQNGLPKMIDQDAPPVAGKIGKAANE